MTKKGGCIRSLFGLITLGFIGLIVVLAIGTIANRPNGQPRTAPSPRTTAATPKPSPAPASSPVQPETNIKPPEIVKAESAPPTTSPEPPDPKALTLEEQLLVVEMERYSLDWLPVLQDAINAFRASGDQATVKAIRKRMNQFEEEFFIPTYFAWKLRTGDIGQVVSGGGANGNQFRIQQIIDGKNMIVTNIDAEGSTIQDFAFANVVVPECWLWISGVNTSNLSDDRGVVLDAIYECKGTRSYVTVLGASRTIKEISPYPVQSLSSIKAKKGEK